MINSSHPSFPSIYTNFKVNGFPRQLAISGVTYLRNGEIGDAGLYFSTTDARERTPNESYSETSVSNADLQATISDDLAGDVPAKVGKRSKKE